MRKTLIARPAARQCDAGSSDQGSDEGLGQRAFAASLTQSDRTDSSLCQSSISCTVSREVAGGSSDARSERREPTALNSSLSANEVDTTGDDGGAGVVAPEAIQDEEWSEEEPAQVGGDGSEGARQEAVEVVNRQPGEC